MVLIDILLHFYLKLFEHFIRHTEKNDGINLNLSLMKILHYQVLFRA